MKSMFLSTPFMILGLFLTLLNGRAASWYDERFHGEEVSLSRASELLKEGKREAYEDQLRNVVMAEDGSDKLRAIALYNLGCSALDRGRKGDRAALKDAFFYFKESLRNEPSLFPAKYNLELLMRMVESKKGDDQKRSTKGEKGDKKEKESKGKVPTTAPPYLGDNP